MAAKIRRKTRIEGEEPEDLLSYVKDRTYGQYVVIGEKLGKMLSGNTCHCRKDMDPIVRRSIISPE